MEIASGRWGSVPFAGELLKALDATEADINWLKGTRCVRDAIVRQDTARECAEIADRVNASGSGGREIRERFGLEAK